MGPLPETPSGNSYILVAGDYFTRWIEAYASPIKRPSPLPRNWWMSYSAGSPHLSSCTLTRDGSLSPHEICSLLHIQKTRTTPYHPRGDGLVERFNRTLQDMLATTCKNHPFEWDAHLRKVCMAYNSSVQSSTGYTPFYLMMFGRQARLPGRCHVWN